MLDVYTERKLAVQAAYQIGSTYQYTGRNATFDGQRVTVVGHEVKGGIVIEYATKRITVSPFSLTRVLRVPVVEVHVDPPPVVPPPAPAARIIRNGQVLPPPPVAVPPEQPVVPARLPKTIRLTGLRAFAPTTGQCHALFHPWLRKLRSCSSRDHRKAVIDRFELTSWLRDRVPPKPGADVYKDTIYYATATLLNYPTRMPPPDQILDLIARRFPVDRLAVNAHIEWMITRLNADHAAFLAHRAGITTEAAR